MSKENEILNKGLVKEEQIYLEEFDLDKLELELEEELLNDVNDIENIKKTLDNLELSETLGDIIAKNISKQFDKQIANLVGADFVKENNGLTLDLRKDSHIQTTKNFEKGKIAKNNSKINYQERYDNWQDKFVKDENGNIKTHKNRMSEDVATIKKDARKDFDKGRPSGDKEKKTAMDHTVPAAEIIRDASANAHMSEKEQIEFANSDKNLNEIDASWNSSKGDLNTEDWINNPNGRGQKPQEIFSNMTDEEVQKLIDKNNEAREEWERRKKEAEEKSIKAGKESRKEETLRAGKAFTKAFVLKLLTDFGKEVVRNLIDWFKNAEKNIKTLWESFKLSIKNFFANIKSHIEEAAKIGISTILSSILGPIYKTFSSVWSIVKQAWQSVKSAFEYLTDPKNKEKSPEILALEVSKIIIAGIMTFVGLSLGEVVSGMLSSVPGFGIEIPLLGSLSSIIGMFVGAVTAGIVGALGLNYIQKLINKKLETDLKGQLSEKTNEILANQHKLRMVREAKLEETIYDTHSSIKNRHSMAAQEIENSLNVISNNLKNNGITQKKLNNISEERDDIDTLKNEINDLLNQLDK